MVITAYSFDEHLATVDDGSVTEEQAIERIDQHFSALRGHYERPEEALAATMFGFSKSPDEFIEICIHAHNQIAFKYECTRRRKLWFLRIPTTASEEITLTSRDAVVHHVRDFFRPSGNAFRAKLDEAL